MSRRLRFYRHGGRLRRVGQGEPFFPYVSTNSANAAGFAKAFEPKETRESPRAPLQSIRNHHPAQPSCPDQARVLS